jgi:hypothetical protein
VAPKNTILFSGIELKWVPDIITAVPIGPDVGVKELMVNVGRKVKPALEVVPAGVVILMLPDAEKGTTAFILVDEIIV